MGVSRVIQTHLFIIVCCVFVVSEDVRSPNHTSPAAVSPVASEGGPIALPNETHMGREHMIKVKHHNVTPEFVVGQKSDNKTSVAKKGVVLPDPQIQVKSSSSTTTSTTTTTTTTTIPPKPTLTIGEDDEPPNASPKLTKLNGITIESVKKHKKTDYVVPIVVVILSVPLVAIIFSVLYKRGSDWWQHRHYRRMDFLINGMYDN